MGMGIVNGSIVKNGNGNKVLSWEWVGMGTVKGILAHLILPSYVRLRQ